MPLLKTLNNGFSMQILQTCRTVSTFDTTEGSRRSRWSHPCTISNCSEKYTIVSRWLSRLGVALILGTVSGTLTSFVVLGSSGIISTSV